MEFKKSIAALMCLAFLTGCQPSPEGIDKDGVMKAQNSGESALRQEGFDTATATSPETAASETGMKTTPAPATREAPPSQQSSPPQTIASTTSSPADSVPEEVPAEQGSIVSTYAGSKSSLSIDAVIITPAHGQLSTYTMEQQPITKERLEQIKKVYFGDKASDLVYDAETGDYRLGDNMSPEYVTLRDAAKTQSPHVLNLSTHGKNLNPYPTNQYAKGKELSFSSKDAMKQCDQFLQAIGLDHYVLSSCVAYGEKQGEDYYRIQYVPVVDGLPLFGRFYDIGLRFEVTGTGIYSVKGNLYRLTKSKVADSILSSEQAQSVLTQMLDSIHVYYKYEIPLDTVDAKNIVKKFYINRIQLSYIASKDSQGIANVVPCWKFEVDATKYGGYSFLLAVNALNGEAIYEESF